MRKTLPLSLWVLPLLSGCPKNTETTTAQKTSTLSAVVEESTKDGGVVVQVDLNADGKADIYNYYRLLEDEGRVLLRKELDLNQDGRIDVWSYFTETGVQEREEMDSDFDGDVDWVDHYQSGKRVMSEIDTRNQGQFDLFKYYESKTGEDLPGGAQGAPKGIIRRKERDTNGDSQIDHWEYFDDKGNVIKVGWDIDGDGQMDVREE